MQQCSVNVRNNGVLDGGLFCRDLNVFLGLCKTWGAWSEASHGFTCSLE